MRKQLVAFRPVILEQLEKVLQGAGELDSVSRLAVEEALMEIKHAKDLYDGKPKEVSIAPSGYWRLDDIGEDWT